MDILSRAFSCFLGILKAALLCLALYPLGKTGYLIRKGIVFKRGLRKVRELLHERNILPNEKFHKDNAKATLLIILPILGWFILYIILYNLLPFTKFIWTLLLLIAPILGFFGVFFTLSDDPSDYIESFLSK